MQVYAQLNIIKCQVSVQANQSFKCQYGTSSNPGNSSSSLVVIM